MDVALFAETETETETEMDWPTLSRPLPFGCCSGPAGLRVDIGRRQCTELSSAQPQTQQDRTQDLHAALTVSPSLLCLHLALFTSPFDC